MKAIIDSEELINYSGGIKWRDFAGGFCDGISLGSLAVWPIGVSIRLATLTTVGSRGCAALIPFTNW